MKRRDLERHLREHGCQAVREGANHTIWQNTETGKRAPVARHRELPTTTAREIAKQLGVPQPPGR